MQANHHLIIHLGEQKVCAAYVQKGERIRRHNVRFGVRRIRRIRSVSNGVHLVIHHPTIECSRN